MCTINKSAHTKKSLETYLMIFVFNVYVKTESGIKKPTLLDTPKNQTKPNQTQPNHQTLMVSCLCTVVKNSFLNTSQ